MESKARQHSSDDTELSNILKLIQASFAYMDQRIDPPSSMHHLSIASLAEQCQSGEVWSMGKPIHACMVLQLTPDALYLGRLAIDQQHQGSGIGKSMIAQAVDRARFHGRSILEIKTRIELVENHAFFNTQGFNKVSEHAHKGYDRPTYIIMRRSIEYRL